MKYTSQKNIASWCDYFYNHKNTNTTFHIKTKKNSVSQSDRLVQNCHSEQN